MELEIHAHCRESSSDSAESRSSPPVTAPPPPIGKEEAKKPMTANEGKHADEKRPTDSVHARKGKKPGKKAKSLRQEQKDTPLTNPLSPGWITPRST